MSRAAPKKQSPERTRISAREVRGWIAANKPAHPGFKLPQSFLEVESERQFEFLRDWQRKVYDAGYLGLDWPAEYGGKGDPHKRQRIVSQELSRAGAPFMVNVIGLQWAGPDDPRGRHRGAEEALPEADPLRRGDLVPGLLRTRRRLRPREPQRHAPKPTDDGWRVTGHKVWTTLAHVAKLDDPAGAHRSRSRTSTRASRTSCSRWTRPASTVQPLVKMSGEGGFNQVIFEQGADAAERAARQARPGLADRDDDAHLRARRRRGHRRRSGDAGRVVGARRSRSSRSARAAKAAPPPTIR